jgi:hypothetical protein
MTKHDSNINLIKLHIEVSKNRPKPDYISKTTNPLDSNEIGLELSDYEKMVKRAKDYVAAKELKDNIKSKKSRWGTAKKDGRLFNTEDNGEIFEENQKRNICRLRGEFATVQVQDLSQIKLFNSDVPVVRFDNKSLNNIEKLISEFEQADTVDASFVFDTALTDNSSKQDNQNQIFIESDPNNEAVKSVESVKPMPRKKIKMLNEDYDLEGREYIKNVLDELFANKNKNNDIAGEQSMKDVFNELLNSKNS